MYKTEAALMMTSHDFEPLLTVSKPVLEVESVQVKYSLFRADNDVLTIWSIL